MKQPQAEGDVQKQHTLSTQPIDEIAHNENMGEGVIALQCHTQKAHHLSAEALEMPMVDQQFHYAQGWGPTPGDRPPAPSIPDT